MKKINILLLFSILLSNAFGQVTLNFRNNSPLPGDSSRTRDISYVDPGKPGENLVWDFSGLQYTGKTSFCGVKDNSLLKIAGTGETNLILSEDGYDYTYVTRENGYDETGYTNTARKMTLGYSDPIAKMKYPFSFGQQFTDAFSGIAWSNGTSRTDLNGQIKVTADAFGTLIFPDRILTNVLRVEAVRQSLQVSVCGSTQANMVKYYWFAPGYRYPVLMVCTSESRYGINEPVIVRSAWVNLNQQASGALAGEGDPGKQAGTAGNTVVVYPNPFTEQVTYSYFLRNQVPVTVELYDMSGKFNIRVEKKQLQTEGVHTGSVNADVHGMPPGVYYLRFTLDNQVVVSKIVKI